MFLLLRASKQLASQLRFISSSSPSLQDFLPRFKRILLHWSSLSLVLLRLRLPSLLLFPSREWPWCPSTIYLSRRLFSFIGKLNLLGLQLRRSRGLVFAAFWDQSFHLVEEERCVSSTSGLVSSLLCSAGGEILFAWRFWRPLQLPSQRSSGLKAFYRLRLPTWVAHQDFHLVSTLWLFSAALILFHHQLCFRALRRFCKLLLSL